MSVRDGLAHGISVLALPYGYTVALWVTGAMAREHYRALGWRDAWAFLAGALGAFLMLAWISRSRMPAEIPAPLPAALALNGLAAVAAAGGTGVCGAIPTSWLGFLMAGFTTTGIYILSIALSAHFASQLRR
ncbi:hypothetical protein [Thermoflexus hugenholtzii]